MVQRLVYPVRLARGRLSERTNDRPHGFVRPVMESELRDDAWRIRELSQYHPAPSQAKPGDGEYAQDNRED